MQWIKNAAPLVLAGAHLASAISGKQLRIIPLGDSITGGTTDQGGYRAGLVQLLDGNYVNMIGSLSDGLFRDNQHEGWSGYSLPDITPRYSRGSAHANANLVIVHGGTNDISFGSPANEAIMHLNDTLRTIHDATPDAVIITSTIGPFCPNASRIDQVDPYNALVRDLVKQLFSQGWRVYLADIRNTLSISGGDITCGDGNAVHPNAQGYGKMSRLYYNTINTISANNPSYFTSLASGSKDGLTGYYTCPLTANATTDFVNPWSVSNLANNKNQYAGIFCVDVSDNPNLCYCGDPSGPRGDGYAYYVAKTRSCLEMTTFRTQAVAFADINGDGRADYLYVGPGGSVESWLAYNQTRRGSDRDNDQAASVQLYSQGVIFGGAFGNRSQVRFGDVDGDGLADYLQVFSNGAITAYSPKKVFNTSDFQQGPGYAGKGQIFSGTYNGVAYPGAGLSFVDINGDLLADLVYTSFGGVVTVFINQGPVGGAFASFGPPQTIYTAPGGNSRDNIILQDTSGDGHADVILVNRTSGAFSIYENTGPSGNLVATFNSTARLTRANYDNTDGANIQFANVGGNGRADWINVDPNTSAFNIRSSQCLVGVQGLYYYYTLP